MRRVKSIITLLIAIAIIVSVFAGCKKEDAVNNGEKGKDAKKQPTEITYWIIDWGAKVVQASKDVVNEFNKSQSDIKVNIYAIPPSPPNEIAAGLTAYDHKFLPAVVAGTAPDIFMPQDLRACIAKDTVLDITNYIEQDKNFSLDIYYDWKKEACKYGGKIYVLPYEIGIGGILMYNKTMFKKSGVDPNEVPGTIAELDAIAEKLYKVGDDGLYTQVGFYPWEWMMRFPRSIVVPFGGKWDDDMGNYTPDDPNILKAFEWADTYVKKYGYDKVNKSLEKLGASAQGFRLGVVGMIFGYNGQVNDLINNDVSFEWGIAPFPGVTEDIAGTWGGGWSVAVTKDSKQPKEAVEFLKYYCGVEGQKIIYQPKNLPFLYGYCPVIEVNQMIKNDVHPAIQVIIDNVVNTIVPKPANPNRKEQKTSAQYNKFLEEMVNDFYSGKGEARQLLEDLKNKATALENQ